jgi:hypothetical protein
MRPRRRRGNPQAAAPADGTRARHTGSGFANRPAALGGAMNDDKPDRRSSRAAQHSREIEENQEALRRSIAETERLVTESENMLSRHRREREADESE